MRVQRLSSVLLGAIVVSCATAVTLDDNGQPVEFPDGSAGSGFDGGQSGGGQSAGGYENGGFPMATGGLGTGGSGNGGRAVGGTPNTGGKNQAGSSGGGTHGGSGGTIASGGRSSTGGVSATGGAATGGGTPTDGGKCQSTEKFCGGVCVSPGPSNGCDLNSCSPCPGPAPDHGVLACDKSNNSCSFVCLSGYTRTSTGCTQPTGSGGGGGGGSTGCGSCPDCGVINGPGCCTSSNTCGCHTFWVGPCH